MGLFKMLKGDNSYLSFGLMIVAVIVAFTTILTRLGACDVPEAAPPRYDYTFKVDNVSFITLKQSKVQVLLKLPSLPEFSDSWTENPQVDVYWRIRTLSGLEFSGHSIGALVPPYDSFIFSIQDDLEKHLKKVHSEQLFIYETRIRLLKNVTNIWLEIRHPETELVLDTYARGYNPELRQKESWSLTN